MTRARAPAPFWIGARVRCDRTTSQPTSTAANPTPWTSTAAGSSVPRAMDAASRPSGASALSGTLAHRRATPRVSAPPSSPASHGSARTGPRASTGGSRVSHCFHPVTAHVARSTNVCGVGTTPTTRESRTASGPPSSRYTAARTRRVVSAIHRNTAARWPTASPRTSPAHAATTHSTPRKPVRSPSSAMLTRTAAKARSTTASRSGTARRSMPGAPGSRGARRAPPPRSAAARLGGACAAGPPAGPLMPAPRRTGPAARR